MYRFGFLLSLGVAVLVGGLSGDARAHGMDPGRMVLQLVGDTAYVVTTPSAKAFADFDQNADGGIDREEVNAQREALLAHFLAGAVVTNEFGVPGEAFFQDIGVPHRHEADPAGPSNTLRLTLRFRWTAAPESVRVRYAFAETAPLSVTASKREMATEGRAARPTGYRLAARFDAAHHEHAFFVAR